MSIKIKQINTTMMTTTAILWIILFAKPSDTSDIFDDSPVFNPAQPFPQISQSNQSQNHHQPNIHQANSHHQNSHLPQQQYSQQPQHQFPPYHHYPNFHPYQHPFGPQRTHSESPSYSPYSPQYTQHFQFPSLYHQPQIPPTPVNNIPPTPVNNIPLVVAEGIAEDAHDELNPLEEQPPFQETQNNDEIEHFFVNSGKRDTPSLFMDGFKFSKNKERQKDGMTTAYFYCNKREKPPKGSLCKAKAVALKTYEEAEHTDEVTIGWRLLSVSNHHQGHYPSSVLQQISQCKKQMRERVHKHPMDKAKKVYEEETNRYY